MRRKLFGGYYTDCNDHQDGRDTESQRETGILAKALDIFPKYGRQQCGEKGTGVNRYIKVWKELLQLSVLLRTDKLFSAECWHAGFNPARADCDNEEPQKRKFPERKRRLNVSIKMCHGSAGGTFSSTYFCGSVFGMEATLKNTFPQA